MITLSSAHCISIGVHFFGGFIVSIFDQGLIFDVVDIFDVSTWPQNKCCHFFFLLQLQEIHTDVGWMVCSTKLRFGENKNKWRKKKKKKLNFVKKSFSQDRKWVRQELCTFPEWRWSRAKILSILIYDQQLQNEATSHLIFCVAGIFCRKIVDHISNFVLAFFVANKKNKN
jgi:hypothetical protein